MCALTPDEDECPCVCHTSVIQLRSPTSVRSYYKSGRINLASDQRWVHDKRASNLTDGQPKRDGKSGGTFA